MFILADRVKETSITSGDGISLLLNDTFGGFQSFATAIGNGNSTYYTIENGVQFEIGIGTYSSSNNSLSRDLVLLSTNNNQRINLDGVSIVFVTYPASSAFLLNQNGYATSFIDNYSGIKFPDGTIQTTAFTTAVNRSRAYITVTEDIEITTSHDIVLLDCTNNNISATLPLASSSAGYTFTLKKISNNNRAIIYPQSGDLIDSQENLQLFYTNSSLSFFSNSNNWYII